MPTIVLALVALCGLTFFIGLGRVGLLGPDEPRYAEVAREMFASGDYVSPRLCGCLWFEKPALYYWLAAASYYLLGVCEYAARLPSALAATLTVLALLWVLWRTELERVAVASSLALATTGIFIGFARAATQDMMLTASVTVALLAGFMWTRAGGRLRIVCWAVLSAATGVAVLAKGLVGVALVLPVAALHLAMVGKLKSIGWRECFWGLAIFLAVVSIWYGPVTARHGWEFVDEFFYRHHFRRYLTNIYHHPEPFYFFPLVAAAGAMPWTFFLVPAVSRLRMLRPRASARDSMLVLAWVWVAWPVIFFSFSVAKLPGYILPIFPALAMIIGVEVERFWNGERERKLNVAAWLTALLLATLAVGFAVYTNDRLVSGANWWRTGLIYLPAAVAAASILLLAARRSRGFVLGTAALTTSLVVGAVALLFPAVTERETLKSFSLETAARLRPGERIGFFIKSEYAPVFYAEGRVVCGVGEFDILNALNEETLVSALEYEPTLVIITGEQWRDEVEGFKFLDAELIGEHRRTLAFRISLKNKNGER